MIINFRQGIISAQVNNDFLEFVNGKININIDIERVDIAFAYGQYDYLFTESEQVLGAWHTLPANKTSYLYWDIDLISGQRTFGFTIEAPTYGATLPSTPLPNHHHFDYKEKKMKVWSGTSWSEKLRVFAGKIENNAILTPYDLGSQVGLNGETTLGYILFDSNNLPLKISNGAGKTYFLTTESNVHAQQDIHNSYKIDSLLMDGKAMEPIPAFHCVTWKGTKQLGVASYIDYNRPCVGISVEPFGKNEIKKFITKGFLSNYNNWNFTDPENTPLFVGDTGQITTTVPQRWSLQKIGHVVSPDTIFIDLQEQILIENTVMLPSVTPSSTPMITLTPMATVTPTPSVSPTPIATVTPTPTVTPTLTPSASNIPVPTGTYLSSEMTVDGSGYWRIYIYLYTTPLCDSPVLDEDIDVTDITFDWRQYDIGEMNINQDQYCQYTYDCAKDIIESDSVPSNPDEIYGLNGIFNFGYYFPSLNDAFMNRNSMFIFDVTVTTSKGIFTTQCNFDYSS